MTITDKGLNLTKQTVAILKSMAGINSNVHVMPGNELVTVPHRKTSCSQQKLTKLSRQNLQSMI